RRRGLSAGATQSRCGTSASLELLKEAFTIHLFDLKQRGLLKASFGMSSTSAIPLIEPARGVTEDMIRRLVETFYDRVLEDEELGLIFRRALSHRWGEHLAIMVDFWSSVALRTGRY